MGVKRERGYASSLLLPPALQGLGWAVNVEGAVRERGRAIGKVLPSLLLSPSLRKPRRAPPAGVLWTDTRKVCVDGMVREKTEGGALD